MEQIYADIFHETRIPYPIILARLTAAIVLGALIGFERERRNRPAGLRTHMLLCLASAVFAIISIESVHMQAFADSQVQIDPLRVIEAVTAGVAFLAAGMIVFSKGEVKGLTTGAGMWLSGAIGLTLGFGHWLIAIFATFAAIAVLLIAGRMQVMLEEDKSGDAKE